MKLLFALLLISTMIFAQEKQEVKTIKIPVEQGKKLADIDKKLKELEPQKLMIQHLEILKSEIISTGFVYGKKQIPTQNGVQYNDSTIFYIEDKKEIKK